MDEEQYAGVFEELRALCGVEGLKISANAETLGLCWKIGRRLAEFEGQIWGARLVKRLSADLTSLYGEGFSASNLFSMRKCAQLYAYEDLDGGLLWSHYRVLVTVADPAARLNLERQVRAGTLTCRTLAMAASRLKPEAQGKHCWSIRPGRTGLYRVERGPVDRVVLDGGFGLKFEPACLGTTVPREVVTGTVVDLDGSTVHPVAELDETMRHCYRGRIQRIIDGDTVALELERARGVYTVIRLRLRNVDALEGSTIGGERAKAVLAGLVPLGTEVLALTYGLDTHGRWIGDVLVGPGTEVLTPGADGFTYINRVLVELCHDETGFRDW